MGRWPTVLRPGPCLIKVSGFFRTGLNVPGVILESDVHQPSSAGEGLQTSKIGTA